MLTRCGCRGYVLRPREVLNCVGLVPTEATHTVEEPQSVAPPPVHPVSPTFDQLDSKTDPEASPGLLSHHVLGARWTMGHGKPIKKLYKGSLRTGPCSDLSISGPLCFSGDAQISFERTLPASALPGAGQNHFRQLPVLHSLTVATGCKAAGVLRKTGAWGPFSGTFETLTVTTFQSYWAVGSERQSTSELVATGSSLISDSGNLVEFLAPSMILRR